MGLPAGYVLRAPVLADVETTFAVASASERADAGREWLVAADVDRAWRLPGFDIAQDAWLVEDDAGVIVAAAWLLTQPGAAMVLVHPRARGRGIGTALRDVVERRAREVIGARTPLKQNAIGSNDAARELLAGAGYARAHRYTSMRIELDGPTPEPELPAGVAVRRLRPGNDDRAVYDLDRAAFAESPDFVAQPFDFFQAEHMRAETLCPAASPMAWEDGELAGFALCERRGESLGYVSILAVRPSSRGRGLGRALLLWSFAALAADGADAAELGVVGGNDKARGLYESVGMRADYVMDRYEKRLE